MDVNKILKDKNPGDQWHSVMAPEEVQYWKHPHGWAADIFRKRGVAIAAVNMKGIVPIAGGDRTEYSIKEPIKLDCGVECTDGYSSVTVQSKITRVKFRIDDAIELNDAMTEFSKMFGINHWVAQGMEIYNFNKGTTIFFERFDPNKTGETLALTYIIDQEEKIKYSDLSFPDMMRAIGTFKESVMSCVCAIKDPEPQKTSECGILNATQLAILYSKEKIKK